MRGAVKVKPVTDYPHRFNELSSVIIESPQGTRRELQISYVSAHGNQIRLGFEEIANREEAEALTGSSLNIPIEQVRPLEEDSYYHFELIGFGVETTTNQYLGKVREIMDLPANAVLVVGNEDNEYLIPAIKDVVQSVDQKTGKIVIKPMEGLLD